jgi:hypothetical protein
MNKKRGTIAIRSLALGCVAALLAMSLPAAADDEALKEAALKHFENGLELSDDKNKNFEGALVEFQASVKLYPTKAGLYNLGVCFRKLARYGEALKTFDRLEKEFGDELEGELQAAVREELDTIRGLTAELVIKVDHEGATVKLDGDEVGTSPLDGPLVLGPREYELRIELEGYKPEKRKLTLVSGQQREEKFELVAENAWVLIKTNDVKGAIVKVDMLEVGATPLHAPLRLDPGDHVIEVVKEGYEQAEPQEVTLGPGEKITLTFALTALPEAPAEPADEGSRISPLFWTGLGLTVAAGAVAGVFWGLADSSHDDFLKYDDQIAATPENDPNASALMAKRNDAEDDTSRFSNLALGFGIGAGVLLVTSGVILALDLGGSELDEPAEVEVSAAPGGLAVSF